MARSPPLLSLFATLLFFFYYSIAVEVVAAAPLRKLALVQQQPLVLSYHNGPLLKGNYSLNILWYGHFSAAQRAVVADFVRSLSAPTNPRTLSVASWWATTARYRGGPASLSLGRQLLDDNYSLGKFLTSADLLALARRAGPHRSALTAVLTSADVAVEGFCMSRCGTHDSAPVRPGHRARFAFLWVGDSAAQCPGQCAWPFYQPSYGPQTPPLVAPSGDVGADGMVINLATLLAGAVTNPDGRGYFQGAAEAPLEAVSACTGIFGPGAYPGYPGDVSTDTATGAGYNAIGLGGRKYLLPAMWDPTTSQCTTTLV